MIHHISRILGLPGFPSSASLRQRAKLQNRTTLPHGEHQLLLVKLITRSGVFLKSKLAMVCQADGSRLVFYVYVSEYVYMCLVCAGSHGRQKRVSHSLKLELQAAVSCAGRVVLGTKRQCFPLSHLSSPDVWISENGCLRELVVVCPSRHSFLHGDEVWLIQLFLPFFFFFFKAGLLCNILDLSVFSL